MVSQLKTEQADDNDKKEYCNMQFDHADDKKKALARSVSDLEAAIEKEEETIAGVKEDIKALNAGIKALDKSVAEATEQRKEKNEDFTELMSSDAAAKELLNFAKNRLNKFYNPKLYKAPPKKELTEAERIEKSVTGFSQAAPPPPPATAAAYSKKSE